MTSRTDFAVTVVIPVYNSAESLGLLMESLDSVLSRTTSDYEIILVDDGSADRSWEVIQDLMTVYRRARGIQMMRNYGQHNAILCGTRAARFPVIVTMDDDLQHPPEEIPRLLSALTAEIDVVYGTPKSLPHSRIRNFLSLVTKRSMARAMGVKRIQDISAFRAFRTPLREAFADFQGPTVLIDVLLSWGTTRFTAVEVEHRPRVIGASNYTFSRLCNQAMLILTGFSTFPLRMASLVGLAFTALGIGVFTYTFIRSFIEQSVPGFPFIASIIALFSGAQLFALGIIGEYLGRVYDRSLDRPTYVERVAIDFPETVIYRQGQDPYRPDPRHR